MLSFKNLDLLVQREHQKRHNGSGEEFMNEELRKAARSTRKHIDRAFDTKIKNRVRAKLTANA